MPIYEYSCNRCRRRMSFLVLTPSSFRPQCRFCQSTDLERLFSRFFSPKSEEQRFESLADPSSLSGLDETDPGSVARWMKKMGREWGDDFGGEEIDRLADQAATEATGRGAEKPDTAGESDPAENMDPSPEEV